MNCTHVLSPVMMALTVLAAASGGGAEPARMLSLADFSPAADGRTDDTAAVARCFAAIAQRGGGVVTIPPGDYFLAGAEPVTLVSHTTVRADGARFHLPERLDDRARLVLFAGCDVCDFAWQGGEFCGHVFDPAQQENAWEPNASTRVIVITTSPHGTTADLLFRDIKSDGIAGAVVTVEGVAKAGAEGEIEVFAQRVRVENCTLLNSGKFMWDYGYLWQVLGWPEDYEPWEVERAGRYFRNDLVRDGVRMEAGDDRVQFDNRRHRIAVSREAEPAQAACFFGGPLPGNITRGRQYFVVESEPEFIRVAEAPGGAALRWAEAGGAGVRLVYNQLGAYSGLFQPVGAGPGKGAFDLQCCRDVQITGCQLSARGDTMHVQRSHNVVFAHNHILGSRMGAFFLAEYCKNATIVGNLVDGTNGSRVMSVERSCQDVTITGNTFRNGGRGSWINQPCNFILQGNIFVNNTTKCEHDPRRGRRGFLTGDYDRFPELYFTRYHPEGSYGPVIVRDNIFITAPSCAAEAVTFAPGGQGLHMSGNVFLGPAKTICVDPGCTELEIRDNPGASLIRAPVLSRDGKR